MRGELEPDIDDAGIARLIDEIQGYWRNNPAVAFRLGWNGVDFAVSAEDGASEAAAQLWHAVVEMPEVKAAITFADEIIAYSLRDGTVEALDQLDDLGVQISLESFATEADLVADTEADADIGGVTNPLAYLYLALRPTATRIPRCASSPSRLSSATTSKAEPIEPCTEISLGLPSGASLAAAALELRAELDERGLDWFSVTLTTALTGSYDTHTAAVTPGRRRRARRALGVRAGRCARDRLRARRRAHALDHLVRDPDDRPDRAHQRRSRGVHACPRSTSRARPSRSTGRSRRSPDCTPRRSRSTPRVRRSDRSSSASTPVPRTSTTRSAARPTSRPPPPTCARRERRQGRVFTLRQQNFELYIIDGVAEIGDPNYTGADWMLAFVERRWRARPN